MKNVFIVNPTSGKGRGLSFEPFINEYYAENGGEYEIIKTEYVGHATEIAARYSAEDDVIIYSVGGDGTMKEILDGIQEGVTLCVIPGGTGNDFYKSVDLRQLSIKEILVACIEGEIVNCDYGVLNGKSKFLNVCSFGLDADINVYACDYVKKELNIPNDFVYLYSTFKVGLHPKPVHIEMEIDGVKSSDDVVLLAVANGKYYGGGFKASPQADLTDGNFEYCYFKAPIKFLRLIYLVLQYMKGKHQGKKECVMHTAKNLKFTFDHEVYYQIDGENHKLTEAVIEMHHQGMKVKMPKERKSY